MKRRQQSPNLGARRQFVAELAAMKARAGQLGLWRTMHALDAATNAAGWEIADIETGKQADLISLGPGQC